MSPHLLDGGRDVRTLSDVELLVRLAGAWDANQGDDLRKLRAESERRRSGKSPAELEREISEWAAGVSSRAAKERTERKRNRPAVRPYRKRDV